MVKRDRVDSRTKDEPVQTVLGLYAAFNRCDTDGLC